MQTFLFDMLQCPNCGEELEWEIVKQDGERIETAEALCRGCGPCTR